MRLEGVRHLSHMNKMFFFLNHNHVYLIVNLSPSSVTIKYNYSNLIDTPLVRIFRDNMLKLIRIYVNYNFKKIKSRAADTKIVCSLERDSKS